MPELSSDSVEMPNAYYAEIREVTVIVQYAPDDGYYGVGMVDNDEVAFIGPYPTIQTCLGALGHTIRNKGYWEE